MTAKEKALEIGNAMYNGSIFEKTKEQHIEELINAKRCALIAVDEILSLDIYQSDQWFYQEVKQEIDNI